MGRGGEQSAVASSASFWRRSTVEMGRLLGRARGGRGPGQLRGSRRRPAAGRPETARCRADGNGQLRGGRRRPDAGWLETARCRGWRAGQLRGGRRRADAGRPETARCGPGGGGVCPELLVLRCLPRHGCPVKEGGLEQGAATTWGKGGARQKEGGDARVTSCTEKTFSNLQRWRTTGLRGTWGNREEHGLVNTVCGGE